MLCTSAKKRKSEKAKKRNLAIEQGTLEFDRMLIKIEYAQQSIVLIERERPITHGFGSTVFQSSAQQLVRFQNCTALSMHTAQRSTVRGAESHLYDSLWLWNDRCELDTNDDSQTAKEPRSLNRFSCAHAQRCVALTAALLESEPRHHFAGNQKNFVISRMSREFNERIVLLKRTSA